MSASREPPVGRGAHINPANRFEAIHLDADFDFGDDAPDGGPPAGGKVATVYLRDDSQSVVSENDSPDIPFRYSLNPYRGCSHGCSYCYARPTHEYLGFSAGLDFETRVLVKPRAADLFRDFLNRPAWRPEPICLSGVTDPYQPAERQLQITRACLEVAREACQPLGIVTKNALVLRDLDLLGEMAARRLVQVSVSITTLDQSLARTLEPRTSSPAARLRAIRELASAGVPVCALLAPIVPGLTDSEIPALLAAAAEAGAKAAGYQLLRLPLAVKPVFLDWLAREQPLKRERVEAAIRATREGALNSSEFGVRMRGTGLLADQIHRLFETFARRCGLDGELPPRDVAQFRPPRRPGRQMRLF